MKSRENIMKERICNAALELFVEKGYEAVSLREIAAGAGTTIGNLTHHFSKKDILSVLYFICNIERFRCY